MTTTYGRLVIAVLAALLCGCTICQSPYDYCSPVTRPDGCPCWCDFSARRNSAFAPPGGQGPAIYGPTEARGLPPMTRSVARLNSREEPPPSPPDEELNDAKLSSAQPLDDAP